MYHGILGYLGTLFLGPLGRLALLSQTQIQRKILFKLLFGQSSACRIFRRKWWVAYSSLLGSKANTRKRCHVDAMLMPCLPLQGAPWGRRVLCLAAPSPGWVFWMCHTWRTGNLGSWFSIVYHFFRNSRSDMQFMSNYTSAAAFRQPNGETRWKKRKRKEQENLWLQDKLLTSTYNTGPHGFV